MKFPPLLAIILLTLTPLSSYGICPTITLRTFDVKRGFSDIQAYQDDKTGMTSFSVTINPATFLSHFNHAFPSERAMAFVTLRPIYADDFKGVTVNLARITHHDPELTVSFEV
jgi:hypothetical protein